MSAILKTFIQMCLIFVTAHRKLAVPSYVKSALYCVYYKIPVLKVVKPLFRTLNEINTYISSILPVRFSDLLVLYVHDHLAGSRYFQTREIPMRSSRPSRGVTIDIDLRSSLICKLYRLSCRFLEVIKGVQRKSTFSDLHQSVPHSCIKKKPCRNQFLQVDQGSRSTEIETYNLLTLCLPRSPDPHDHWNLHFQLLERKQYPVRDHIS